MALSKITPGRERHFASGIQLTSIIAAVAARLHEHRARESKRFVKVHVSGDRCFRRRKATLVHIRISGPRCESAYRSRRQALSAAQAEGRDPDSGETGAVLTCQKP
jgi:hypothetical protein